LVREAPSRRKGGWTPSKFLEWADVADAHWLVDQYGLNVSLDIMPDQGSDQERKRFIQQKTNRLGEAISRRRGEWPIGFTTFEKGGPDNRDLHGHHMVKVDRRDFDVIERHADGEIVRASILKTRTDRLAKAGYITKQRRGGKAASGPLSQHRYEQSPAPVLGKRISWTKTAAAILQPRRDDRAARKALQAARQRALVAETIAKAASIRLVGQGELFHELERPAARLRDFHGGILPPAPALELEFRRRRLGLTQRQLASMAGLSQPQYANAVQGRFGLSPSAAARLKAVLADLITKENAA
jgi:hypothetical protein